MARARVKFLYQFLFSALLVVQAGCSLKTNRSSSQPIKPPSFAGEEVISVVTTKSAYVLLGLCDANSKGLEYSYDGQTWSSLAPDCASGRFSLHLVGRQFLYVQVRAKTPHGYTPSAYATVEFASKNPGVQTPRTRVAGAPYNLQ